MKRLLGVLAVACALTLTACGTGGPSSSSTTTLAPAPVQPAAACQPGRSFAGCSTTGLPSTGRLGLAPIRGAEFPDVSSWQGHPGWEQVKAWQQQHGWSPGGVFKLGEYQTDPDAAWNSARLSQLGMWKAGYWFVRNTGCAHEASLIVADARAFGLHAVWLDIEVPEAAGYSTCLVGPVKAAGFAVGIYTGPGTWPGGNAHAASLWDAAYNFSGPQFGGLWTGRALAWQFTDGAFAAKTDVPGIGFDDVSVDLGGFAKLAQGAAPKPKDPYAILDRTVRHIQVRGQGTVVASEHGTVTTGYAHGCRRPLRRAVCKSSDYHLRVLRGRLIRVALREHPHYKLKGQGARQTIMAKAEGKW